MTIAFSQACENNKQPILTVLSQAFATTKTVLEVGSGTGQHAIYFAKHLPHLSWYTSDLPSNHPSINHRIKEAQLSNLHSALSLDLANKWPQRFTQAHQAQSLDGIFTANTMHIISWSLVEKFFHQAGKHLAQHGTLCIYGPFNYQGKFTSKSNANFDLWLKERDVNSGIRDIEKINQQAALAGLQLTDDHEMPANNRLLTFSKS
ncbi:DUF938 domain-containing protein [Thalassotalea sp. G2M2-11]|uniref:DUF938 domain-containing protein n=1 Tax=Thalassotalea sp. G2M2-11 TaxID=2787627 RepID=UPI0019D12055|nr:DUF938 domain-containing protein [Thalassotalea sp. G2M2-11]